jgi:hypothetical protein
LLTNRLYFATIIPLYLAVINRLYMVVTDSIVPTSGPFGDSMSAAARPKRWGLFRQAKGREFDLSRVKLLTLLYERAIKGTWGDLGRQKEKEMIIHK